MPSVPLPITAVYQYYPTSTVVTFKRAIPPRILRRHKAPQVLEHQVLIATGDRSRQKLTVGADSFDVICEDTGAVQLLKPSLQSSNGFMQGRAILSFSDEDAAMPSDRLKDIDFGGQSPKALWRRGRFTSSICDTEGSPTFLFSWPFQPLAYSSAVEPHILSCMMLCPGTRIISAPHWIAIPILFGALPTSKKYRTYEIRRMAASSAKSLDHIVLTVQDIPATIKWYGEVLNMAHTSFTSGGVERHALKFGDQKINLHQSGSEFEPKAQMVQPGSGDLCFIVEDQVDDVLGRLQEKSVQVLEGGKVVDRTGARGKLRSVYVRDPDGNLIE